jgi:phosphoglycerol transferase MdoB-like AlkP superfamily enzyme
MENPLINSAYAGNTYESLASLLRNEGYTTAFFHGGINGTMNFDSYAAQAGYNSYYGKNEYGNDDDFDGFWGIWDEPFLAYSVKKMNEMKEPFHSSIFTLSSHHPYLIPKKYTGKFPKGTLENHESIGYGDYALRHFFTEAKKQKWYKNTLFVITADHCSVSSHPFFRNNLGQFSIPILFYMPDNSLKGNYAGVFQQADIMPSVLNQLGYSKPFFSFGRSYKDPKEHYVNYYTNSSQYMLTDSLLFNFIGNELSSVYRYKSDSLLINNIASKFPFNKEKTYYKAFIQTYNNSLINNTCLAK